jgi:hypothetical protein
MRQLSNGTTLAIIVTGATALATAATQTAYAHDGVTFNVSPYEATTLDHEVPLSAEVYHEFFDARLDVVEAKAAALKNTVAAIPSDTVLNGAERMAAKARLAKVSYLARVLANLPDSGAFAPTATEATQIARIRAMLDAIAAKLKTLLANAPAVVTPTTVKPLAKTLGLRDLSLFDGHHCDGHWGDRDGRWDGWRYDGSRWRDFRWHH